MDNNINIQQNAVPKKSIKTKTLMWLIIIGTCIVCTLSFPIGSAVQYKKAVDIFNAKDYAAAYKVFDKLEDYKDSNDKKNACIYAQAKKYAEEKKYIKAYEKFMTIEEYSDTKEQMKAIYNDYKKEQISLVKSAKKGDTVTLGKYDNKQVEWVVLSVNKDKKKALLISKYSLVKKPFDKSGDVTWRDSSIRKWLNKDFYKSTFDNVEQSIILTSQIKNKKNPEYNESSGKNTNDKLFLLSIEEANKYFIINSNRVCKDLNDSTTEWFLRTQGDTYFRIAYVQSDGEIYGAGHSQIDSYGIRPAMWISIK